MFLQTAAEAAQPGKENTLSKEQTTVSSPDQTQTQAIDVEV